MFIYYIYICVYITDRLTLVFTYVRFSDICSFFEHICSFFRHIFTFEVEADRPILHVDVLWPRTVTESSWIHGICEQAHMLQFGSSLVLLVEDSLLGQKTSTMNELLNVVLNWNVPSKDVALKKVVPALNVKSGTDLRFIFMWKGIVVWEAGFDSNLNRITSYVCRDEWILNPSKECIDVRQAGLCMLFIIKSQNRQDMKNTGALTNFEYHTNTYVQKTNIYVRVCSFMFKKRTYMFMYVHKTNIYVHVCS